MEELQQVSCDPQCGFMIQSHDSFEITDDVKKHAKKAHGMDLSDADVKAKMKKVS